MAYGFTNHDWGYRSLHDYLMMIYKLPIYCKENVYECMTNWHGQVKETARLSRPKQVVVSATASLPHRLQN